MADRRTIPSNRVDPFQSLGTASQRLMRLVRETPPERFQDEAVAVLRGALRFDVSMWGSATVQDAVIRPHSYHVTGITPERSAEAYIAYEAVKEGDWVARTAIARPGTCVSFDGRAPPGVADSGWLAFLEAFDIRHALSTMLVQPISKLAVFLSLYRANLDDPFAEDERRLLEALVPILAYAWDVNRLHAMEAGRVARDPDAGTAMADAYGFLHVAEPRFEQVLRAEWPAWSGPTLPDQLLTLIARGGTWRGSSMAVRAAPPVNGFTTLRAQPRSLADRLSAREREIARMWADGKQTEEIAGALGLRPVSVRNRLQRIYLKLEVHGRLEMLRALEAGAESDVGET